MVDIGRRGWKGRGNGPFEMKEKKEKRGKMRGG